VWLFLLRHHTPSLCFADDYSSSMTKRQKELMANKDVVTAKEEEQEGEDLTVYSQVTKSVLPF
jgi:hypothetical protein